MASPHHVHRTPSRCGHPRKSPPQPTIHMQGLQWARRAAAAFGPQFAARVASELVLRLFLQ